MSNLSKSLLLLLGVILLSLAAYAAALRPFILHWGASESETSAFLPGDDMAPYTSSTRAVTIDAPKEVVWQWLVQLGGDRGGFYSYTILENLLGYDTDNTIVIVPEFQEMKVGRLVVSTPPSAKGTDKMSWKVVAVDPGKFFVLQGWGAFVLREAAPGKTRLIVRTHGWATPSLAAKLGYFFTMPLHYLMERRMMLGIKARAEAGTGVPLSSLPDYLWLAGVFLSLLGIIALTFLAHRMWQALAPLVYGVLWLWVCLIADPTPGFALALLAVVAATMVWFSSGKSRGNRAKYS
ncbi:MAG: hypothetical protein KQI62_10425 [Deltaproteobacteria bacterium]|nr:hypothetical protein [Deltaproteobacteria bacterium]